MKVYFGQPWGGLGDNLQFTTLPKLFSEKGVDFFISQYNTYRNPEIYEFCWAKNPYVKGIVSNVANVGACAPDIKKGVTNIKFNKKYINLEKYNITCGDLILFRFDLPHKITPVDPDKYLSFDTKGRWTLLFSIAPKHLSLTSY